MNEEMRGVLSTPEKIRSFMFAGNATFTIRSTKTGTRFTYKIRVAETEAAKPDTWFVSLLRGQDNESDYAYMGIVRNRCEFRHTNKSRVTAEAQSAKAFQYLFDTVVLRDHLPSTLEIWHEGRCGRCGRKLTVPESIERGLGPDCADSSL